MLKGHFHQCHRQGPQGIQRFPAQPVGNDGHLEKVARIVVGQRLPGRGHDHRIFPVGGDEHDNAAAGWRDDPGFLPVKQAGNGEEQLIPRPEGEIGQYQPAE